MNMERAALKGHLADRKMRLMKLGVSIAANLKAAKTALLTVSIAPVLKIDIEGALVHLGEAKRQQDEYRQLSGEIEALEEELG